MNKIMRAAIVVVVLSMARMSIGDVLTGHDVKISMQPTEKLTISCDYVGRTLSSHSMTVTLLKGTDASPSAIVTNSSVTGSQCQFTLAPTSRHGRQYQVTCLATDSTGDKLACDVLLVVRTVRFQPDEG